MPHLASLDPRPALIPTRPTDPMRRIWPILLDTHPANSTRAGPFLPNHLQSHQPKEHYDN